MLYPLDGQRLKLAAKVSTTDTTIDVFGRFQKDSEAVGTKYIIGQQILGLSPNTDNEEFVYVNVVADPTEIDTTAGIYRYTVTTWGIESDNATIPPTLTDATKRKTHAFGDDVWIVNSATYYKQLQTYVDDTVNDKVVQMSCVNYTTGTATGDGYGYITIPQKFNGCTLSRVHARVITAGTTGTTDVQLARIRRTTGESFSTNDMLSTKLTIDSGEVGSETAETPAVINATYATVATNDVIRIDIDAVSTTAAKGLIITLEFTTA